MRRLARACAIGLGTGLLGVLLASTPPGAALEQSLGLAWLFKARGPVAPPKDVAVISLDRHSAGELGLPERLRDWPRTVYAALIGRLVEAGASVIVLDLMFLEPHDEAQDAAFAEAMAAAGDVVLLEKLDQYNQEIPDAKSAVAGTARLGQLVPPLPALARAASGVAPFPLPRQPRRVDEFPAFLVSPQAGPTLPLVVLQRYAMPVYPEWLELLRAAGFADIARLPRLPEWVRGAPELQNLITRLRRGFIEDPTLAGRLRQSLAGAEFDPDATRVLGSLIAGYAGPDRRFLNFYGSAGRIRTLPLHEVLGAEPGPGAASKLDLAGRVVFVGLSDPTNWQVADVFVTVFARSDGVDVNGVEIAATAFANLLDQRTLDRAGTLLRLCLLGGFGFAVGVSASLLPALLAVPLSLGIGAAYFAGAVLAFAAAALWLPVTVPLLVQLPLGLFAGLVTQYRDARRARANISRGMRYYLPETVAAQLAEAPDNPTAIRERVFAACMVTDAERFTTLAEGMKPEEVSALLDRYFEILFGIVERHGGVVTDVVGDGMTCVWTAPVEDRSCRLKASLAALEIQRTLAGLGRERAPIGLATRIGLNAGLAVLGNVGGSGRFIYSVVGDVANTAARLETLNKQLGTRLLATAGMSGDLSELVVRPLGRLQLFGKHEVLPIVEIVGPAGEPHDLDLLASFADALDAFQEQRWPNAAARFEAILDAHPSDGPSRFYLEQCRRYLSGAAAPEAPGLLKLERK